MFTSSANINIAIDGTVLKIKNYCDFILYIHTFTYDDKYIRVNIISSHSPLDTVNIIFASYRQCL